MLTATHAKTTRPIIHGHPIQSLGLLRTFSKVDHANRRTRRAHPWMGLQRVAARGAWEWEYYFMYLLRSLTRLD